MKLFPLTLACAALALGGCVTTQTAPQRAYQVEADYTAALAAAVAYRDLPTCGSGSVLCHDPAVTAKLVVLNRTAAAALATYRDAVLTGQGPAMVATLALDAQANVAAFSEAIASLKVK